MKNWIATKVLQHLYKGYLITATFPYSVNHSVTVTFDLGRLAAGDEGAVEYEVTENTSGEYLN